MRRAPWESPLSFSRVTESDNPVLQQIKAVRPLLFRSYAGQIGRVPGLHHTVRSWDKVPQRGRRTVGNHHGAPAPFYSAVTLDVTDGAKPSPRSLRLT